MQRKTVSPLAMQAGSSRRLKNTILSQRQENVAAPASLPKPRIRLLTLFPFPDLEPVVVIVEELRHLGDRSLQHGISPQHVA